MANLQTVEESTANLESITVELEKLWLAYESQKNQAFPDTIKAYRRGLEVWKVYLKDIGHTGIITPKVILDFRTYLKEKYAPQTVNLRLTAIRRFYSFMVNTNRLPYNPASEIKNVKRSNSRVHKRDALTTNEVRCLLNNCDITSDAGLRDYAMIALMAYCGLRTVEVFRANCEDLQTKSNRLVLFVQGKGYEDADNYVVIPAAIEFELRQWYSIRKQGPLFTSFSNRSCGKRLSRRAIRSIVKKHFADCGIVGKNKSTHSLRHTAITNAIANDATPMQVQAMARHNSFDTTLNYIHEYNRLESPAEDLINY